MSNWKSHLHKYAPTLVDFLGPSPAEWRRIDEELEQRLASAEAAMQRHGSASSKTTLYDLVVNAYGGDRTSQQFLAFIDHQAAELKRLLPSALHQTARKQSRDLFLNFSDQDSHYLEKFGELAAFVYLLETTRAQAAGFETRISLDCNTKLDITVKLEKGPISVEILNILIDDRKIVDAPGLQKFLDGRIARKIFEKTGIQTPANQLPFPLLLVLWFQEVDTLRRFASDLIAFPTGHLMPICALLQLTDPNENKVWAFGSISYLSKAYGLSG